ncbi:MAG: insulinase family protein [Candidatus Microsaccharimonas sossegonensis]|uniref:Insulinase family protein n=1 Tax=Candidatus Microsaccharimonas sossegonensis TaxID=2506948 RepID=A0A4Q0AHD6_9BACT|nr:MAG: insulinase family protein [Candidatus Microsaccharimonas sossegonensis]
MNHTVEEVKLKNGAKGLLINIPGATVMSMQFQFRAGSRYAKRKDIEQVAHIMEHMAFGANAKFKSEHDFESEFTKNGAYHNAYTSDLALVYEADCADFEWDRILELQKVSICQPKFNATELEAEKGNVRSELTNYLNDHHRILWPRVQQLLGEDVLTYRQAIATIANVTLADIREHHKRTHTTDNMRFVIAGKLRGRKSEIIRQLETFELPRGERFEVPRDELKSAHPALIRRKDATNLTFGFTLSVPRELSDEELDAMHNLNHILTGTTHSRIFGKARSKGLAYSVGSYTGAGFYDSAWDISGQVNHDTAPELFKIIATEIQAVLDGKLSDEEIEAAKSFGLGRYQMGAQTVSQISGFYTNRYFADDFIKDYGKVPDLIRRVTREKIMATTQSFVDANTWVLAAVSSGDRDEIVELGDALKGLFKASEAE